MSDGLTLPYHRKYRSTQLSEYIGNTKLKESAMKALESATKPQVILMVGNAGCGKTTFARLLAKEYLCEDRDTVNGACGVCENCLSMVEYIETGEASSLYTVKEVDITDNNKKEDIDELLEDAKTPDFDGNWKIYILDECHMLSKTAQNRLLKTLEEPAEKVLMILCTTDPQMLLETIISRCQYEFKVTKPKRSELVGLLQHVCESEGVPYENKGLSLICAKGDFVPRKTLIELEKVVRSANRVTYGEVVNILDVVADVYFYNFYRFFRKDDIDVMRYIQFIGTLREEMSVDTFVDNLLTFTMRGVYVVNGVKVEALDTSEISQYKKLFGAFGQYELMKIMEVLLRIKKSRDKEAELLMLGYRGLVSDTTQTSITTNTTLIEENESDTGIEKTEGEKKYIESITMGDDKKKELIEENSKKLSADDLLSRFNNSTLLTK